MNRIANANSKKIMYLVVLIITLMITVTGATYAFLIFDELSSNSPTGTAASSSLNLQLGNSANTTSGIPSLVKPIASFADEPMAPQYAYQSGNVLQNAVNANCLNGYSNVTCKIYTFTIRNNSTASARVKGRLYFDGISTMPNLRWAVMTSASVVSISGTTTADNMRTPLESTDCTPDTTTENGDCWFETGVLLNPSGGITSTNAASGSYKQYWIIIWVNETTGVQVDTGTWHAGIEFMSSIGDGITSTIT